MFRIFLLTFFSPTCSVWGGLPSSGSSLGSLLNHRHVFVVVSNSAQLPEKNIFFRKILNFLLHLIFWANERRLGQPGHEVLPLLWPRGQIRSCDTAGEGHRESVRGHRSSFEVLGLDPVLTENGSVCQAYSCNISLIDGNGESKPSLSFYIVTLKDWNAWVTLRFYLKPFRFQTSWKGSQNA